MPGRKASKKLKATAPELGIGDIVKIKSEYQPKERYKDAPAIVYQIEPETEEYDCQVNVFFLEMAASSYLFPWELEVIEKAQPDRATPDEACAYALSTRERRRAEILAKLRKEAAR